MTEPLERLAFEAATLFREHPPVFHHPHKQLVFDIACPPGAVHAGRIACTRWAAMPLPGICDTAGAARRLREQRGYYDYARTSGYDGAVEWHVNFADPHLFAAYGSGLFAQDELQVAEHPALGALREALLAEGFPAVTVEADRPTPVLVMGVERRCHVDTARSGLYGNAFARAKPDAIRRATTAVMPPTISNVIAMAAPFSGSVRYTAADIEYVLRTAFTGFHAAALESRRLAREAPVVVHSGFWGCGAFGGNRILMSGLQILAAELAGVEQLVLHALDEAGAGEIETANRLVGKQIAGGGVIETGELIRRVAALGFEWGVSDGN
jgi:Poly (ADP-ribose) glycohydrolase (PARG), Macro domain fold